MDFTRRFAFLYMDLLTEAMVSEAAGREHEAYHLIHAARHLALARSMHVNPGQPDKYYHGLAQRCDRFAQEALQTRLGRLARGTRLG